MVFPWLLDWLLARGYEAIERAGLPARPRVRRILPA